MGTPAPWDFIPVGCGWPGSVGAGGGHPPTGVHSEPPQIGCCRGGVSACQLWFYSPISCRLPVWLAGLSLTPGSCRGLGTVGVCVGTLARLPIPHLPWDRARAGAAGSSRAAFPQRAARGHGVGSGTARLATRHRPQLPLTPSLAGREAAARPRLPRMTTPPAWPPGAGKSHPEPLAWLAMRGWGGSGWDGVPIPAGTWSVLALAELCRMMLMPVAQQGPGWVPWGGGAPVPGALTLCSPQSPWRTTRSQARAAWWGSPGKQPPAWQSWTWTRQVHGIPAPPPDTVLLGTHGQDTPKGLRGAMPTTPAWEVPSPPHGDVPSQQGRAVHPPHPYSHPAPPCASSARPLSMQPSMSPSCPQVEPRGA